MNSEIKGIQWNLPQVEKERKNNFWHWILEMNAGLTLKNHLLDSSNNKDQGFLFICEQVWEWNQVEEGRRRLPLLAALESPSQLEGIDDVIRIPHGWGYIKRPRDRKKEKG